MRNTHKVIELIPSTLNMIFKGALVSLGSVYLDRNISDSKELKEIPIKLSVATHPPVKDTVYIGSLKDSLGVKVK